MSPLRRRPCGGALAIIVALLLGAPVHAVAADTYPVSGGSLVYGLVSGTDGYRVHFSEWARNHRHRFKVAVDGHHATVTYEVPAGRDPADGIAANLGRRGRFGLRLVKTGKPKDLAYQDWCEGPHGHWQRGYLSGIGRFRGENGYTEVHFRRVRVIFESWPSFRCHYAEGGGGGEPRRAQVFAHRRSVGFGAVLASRHAAPADRRVLFRAWMGDSAGRLRIAREVRVPATESSFSFPGGPKLPEEVTVEPPSPFAGTATFSRTPESTFSWSGDLSVEFPGTRPIRLAGPSFGAGVCDADRCVRQEPEREPPG
ncbi:MAG TPA: hypothetical protein VJL81_07750 [Solirubrobacterales bacterium]|nr:hypothetical protein [Solirubrobacterales bacterium]